MVSRQNSRKIDGITHSSKIDEGAHTQQGFRTRV